MSDNFSQLMFVLKKSKRGQSDFLINRILDSKPDVNQKDTKGRTPLTLALRKKFSPQIINRILDLNPDINAKDEMREPPLIYALEKKYPIDIINRILDSKPTINSKIFKMAIRNTNSSKIINRLKEKFIVDDIIKFSNGSNYTAIYIIKFFNDSFSLDLITEYDYFLINEFEDFKKLVDSGKINIEEFKEMYYFSNFPLYTKNELIRNKIFNEFNIDIMIFKDLLYNYDDDYNKEEQSNEKSWLDKYIRGDFMNKKILIHHIDTNIEKELKKTINKESYTVYRGYSFEDKNHLTRWFNENLNIIELNKNDIFKRKFDYYSAWSECIKISYDFALGKMNYALTTDYGVILKLKISKNNVLADLNNISKLHQCEIVIKPGIYKVEVYDIIYNEESIKSTNLLSKEISIESQSETN